MSVDVERLLRHIPKWKHQKILEHVRNGEVPIIHHEIVLGGKRIVGWRKT